MVPGNKEKLFNVQPHSEEAEVSVLGSMMLMYFFILGILIWKII